MLAGYSVGGEAGGVQIGCPEVSWAGGSLRRWRTVRRRYLLSRYGLVVARDDYAVTERADDLQPVNVRIFLELDLPGYRHPSWYSVLIHQWRGEAQRPPFQVAAPDTYVLQATDTVMRGVSCAERRLRQAQVGHVTGAQRTLNGVLSGSCDGVARSLPARGPYPATICVMRSPGWYYWAR